MPPLCTYMGGGVITNMKCYIRVTYKQVFVKAAKVYQHILVVINILHCTGRVPSGRG